VKKKRPLTVTIGAIVVLFTVTLALYGAAVLIPDSRPATGTQPEDEAATPDLPGPWSALNALKVSDASPDVQGWMAGRKAVSVAGISSDFCDEGQSGAWTIVYSSDDGQIVVSVIQDEPVDVRASTSSLQQGLDLAKVIDSDLAWQAVAADITKAGGEPPATVSMALKAIGGRPGWEVSYPVSDGYRIVRVDAVNGSVIQGTTVGQG